ncbi:L-threonylcarbamoyladenylate synthase [Humidesulfovibrio mexicanus]|uniref:L-threonylcarbamoyladenylate synthase n=1 Tax=Humidesulfovibrio mexicanus TaxID=147047 RepID=A0A239AP42_9BACT|nr:L-threonylcarbamoyladenylate synthase [Humidesulfovibrio mexicanus]SNR96768.1 L-threonylcarbamoyladenylate synthase [Humidesulfovibrio mexicanus]
MDLELERGLAETAAALAHGGVAVYPTETLYALGCRAEDARACARIAALKGRPEAKPFPLIVADMDGLAAIAEELPEDVLRLAGAFWPGPLSVLVRTRDSLPRHVRDADGFSSVRMSPHPTARALCRLAGPALVATSANKSGRPATALPAELDPGLLAGADASLLCPPLPGGGAPSTLVRLLGGGRLRVLRLGAVDAQALGAVFRLEPHAP